MYLRLQVHSLITQLNLDIEIIVISHNRVWNKRPWASYISADVFEKIQSNIKTNFCIYSEPKKIKSSQNSINRLFSKK